MTLNNYIVRFDKNDRSSFPYWFSHWCAFNLTALNLKMWKFKYLFHDIEKPWLKLFLPYKKVQRFHNIYNSHHLLYYFIHHKADWEAMIIDWECGRLTKQQCPRNAIDEYYRKFENFKKYIYDNIKANEKSIIYFEEKHLDKDYLKPLIRNAYNQLYRVFEDKFGFKVDKYDEHYLSK